MAERLKIASAKDTIPLMNASASSLTFYQKGAWALHILKREVGDINFAKAVKNYLTKYAFSNVKTDDFLAEIRKVSSYDTEKFKREWLQSSGFDSQKAISILKENPFMQKYFDVLAKTEIPFEEKKKEYLEILNSDANPYIKEEILMQLTAIPFENKKEFLEVSMDSKNLKVRQAVAKSLDKIPASFYNEYLSLLDDESYITQEIALNMLWSQFAEKRVNLLEKTKEILTKINTKAPLALTKIIHLVNEAATVSPTGLSNEINAFGDCFDTKDKQEGTAAFLEKRTAVFAGQ